MKKIFLVFGLVIFLASVSLAVVPGQINVQGVLKDSSGTLLIGNKAITFTIYSDSQKTTTLWSDTYNVTLNGGIYNVQLGSNAAKPISSSVVFDGNTRYLGVTVDGTERTPLMALITVPYAFRAAVADSVLGRAGVATSVVELGPASQQSIKSQYGISVKSTYENVTAVGVGVRGEGDIGILGEGKKYGVRGITTAGLAGGRFESRLDNGVGIHATGFAKGGSFEATGADGFGVYGRSVSGHGVYGETSAIGYNGIQGSNDFGTGVFGYSRSLNGYGVYGRNVTPGGGTGVYGLGTFGTGVRGVGNVYGGSFEATGAGGVGVRGVGSGVGGIGGSFEMTEANGIGVYGRTKTPGGGGFGVRGTSDGNGTGVMGTSAVGTGVAGTSTNGVGGYFESTTNAAVYIDSVLRLNPRTTEPVNPAEGMIYYNYKTKKIYVYTGSAWNPLN